MRRTLLILAGVLVAAALAIPAAFAAAGGSGSPHFLYANSSVSSSTGALNVDFKDAGLGTTITSVQISLHVDTATATYQCWNLGGHHPKAGNKETVSETLDITQSFPVRNGQATGTITVGPPGPGDFTCPTGQDLFLVDLISYSGIYISDESPGNTLEATPDPASADVGHPPSGGILITPAHG
jgi:hypothetical protein